MAGTTDDAAIADAVAGVGLFVSGDGGRLELLESDPDHRRIRLRLDLSGVECLDCVIPPEMLREMITSQLSEALDGFDIVVEDPREIAPTAPTQR